MEDGSARRWVRAALAAYPVVAVALYIFQYTYAYQYLLQFGVSPEDVGISQLEFATRAAVLGLVLGAVYGGLAVFGSLGLVVRDYTSQEPWRTPGSAQRHLWHSYVIVILAVVALLLARVLGGRWDWGQFVFVAVSACAAFLLIRRRSRELAAIVALCAATFGALSWAAYAGGARAGVETAESGAVPPLLAIFGVDVRQVVPTWIGRRAKPARYRGQDLLDLGSDGSTIFLYDCSNEITHRIPLAEVALGYSLAKSGDDELQQSLKCR